MKEVTILSFMHKKFCFLGLLSFCNPVCYQLLWEEKSSRDFWSFVQLKKCQSLKASFRKSRTHSYGNDLVLVGSTNCWWKGALSIRCKEQPFPMTHSLSLHQQHYWPCLCIWAWVSIWIRGNFSDDLCSYWFSCRNADDCFNWICANVDWTSAW